VRIESLIEFLFVLLLLLLTSITASKSHPSSRMRDEKKIHFRTDKRAIELRNLFLPLLTMRIPFKVPHNGKQQQQAAIITTKRTTSHACNDVVIRENF